MFNRGDVRYLEAYSDTALRRVWASVRLSWWLTNLLHAFPEETAFDQRLKENQFAYLASSEHA